MTIRKWIAANAPRNGAAASPAVSIDLARTLRENGELVEVNN
jgi:hypothetical protein